MTKEKSQAELQIEALADVFNIATEGFEQFYKDAKEKNSAAQGDYSNSAAQGYYSKSAAQGYYSNSAAQGYYSKSAAQGDYSNSAAQGYYSKSAAQGDYSNSAAQGDYSKSAAQGGYSKSAAQGGYSKSAAQGYYSNSAAQGYYSKSSCKGKNSVTAALGYRAMVSGDVGNGIAAFEFTKEGSLVGAKAGIIDGKILKPNRWYIVEKGEWVEVDFADNIFSYVLSNRAGVKKVKTEKGNILYIVSDENGNSAHGRTIKQAREDLVYKVVAKFEGKLPKKATGAEWISIYRAVTGACSEGVKHFVEQQGKSLDDVYTAKQIAKLVQGQFGAEAFAKKLEE